MKWIIIGLLMIVSMSARAQKLDDVKGEYCQFKVSPSKPFSATLKIWLVSNEKGFYLKDKMDKEIEPKTVIDALNYFFENGWEYVDRHTDLDAGIKMDWILIRRKK